MAGSEVQKLTGLDAALPRTEPSSGPLNPLNNPSTPPAPLLYCKQCKRNRPDSEFLWKGKRGRFRIRLCNECAGSNMKRYWATRMVGRKPEEFSDAGD